MTAARVLAGVPTGGQFATSARSEAAVDLTTPTSPAPGTHLDTTVPVSDLVDSAYSTEWDSPVSGVEEHLDAERIARYAALPTHGAPPLHLCLPVPGEEPEPTLLDGHHRLFAAVHRGDHDIAVRLHAPLIDEDGDVTYPSLPARLGGDGQEAGCTTGTLGGVSTQATDEVGEETLRGALTFATDYCDAAGGARPGMCHAAAWNVEAGFGWPIVSGRRGGVSHHWNAMPDGRIFDATAAQFGDGGPLVTSTDDARYEQP